MTKAQSEKRSSKRVKVQDKVKVKVGNGVAHDAQAQLRDVSLRGVFLYLQNKVAEGSTLEVVLPLPQGVIGRPRKTGFAASAASCEWKIRAARSTAWPPPSKNSSRWTPPKLPRA